MADFKATISEAFGAPAEELCLIYADKILKDHETLKAHGIKDGKTVHLVIRTSEESDGGRYFFVGSVCQISLSRLSVHYMQIQSEERRSILSFSY